MNTENTLSGFQEFFLQPIIKDRPNYSQNSMPLNKYAILRLIIKMSMSISEVSLSHDAFFTGEFMKKKIHSSMHAEFEPFKEAVRL